MIVYTNNKMNGAYFYEDEDSTGKYILPKKATKSKYKEAFRCCDCNESLVLCKGDKNVDYFRHCKDTTCIRYDKPHLQTKRRLHEEAKLQLKSWIQQERVIRIKRRCCCCKKQKYQCYTTMFDMLTKVKLEHRYNFDDRYIFYDVVHLTYNDEIIEAFEIVDTHKTEEENRPDNIKWYEVSADEIMKKAMEHFEDNYEIILNNERVYTCKECVMKANDKKIEDDILEEEIRCKRQETILKKQQDDEARLLKNQQDNEARLLKEKRYNEEEEKIRILKEQQEKIRILKEQENDKNRIIRENALILKEKINNDLLIIIRRFLDGKSNDNSLYETDELYKQLYDIEKDRRKYIGEDLKNQHLKNYKPIYTYTNDEIFEYWKKNPMKPVKKSPEAIKAVRERLRLEGLKNKN